MTVNQAVAQNLWNIMMQGVANGIHALNEKQKTPSWERDREKVQSLIKGLDRTNFERERDLNSVRF